MEHEDQQVRVHLVHGTWATGLLKPRNAWFEQGSETYERLRRQLPQSAQIESFLWSGRNTVASRAEAGQAFSRHLQQSVARHPDSTHVVVAHSHGGTVAVEALSNLDDQQWPRTNVKALVCLATPFVYLTRPSLTQHQTAFLAMTSLLYAVYWSALLAAFPFIPAALSPAGFAAVLAIKGLIAYMAVVVLALAVSMRSASQVMQMPPTSVPIYLLRATRDEASLSLGLMQAFGWLSAAFARYNDVSQGTVRRPLTWVAYALVYSACLAVGLWFSQLVGVRMHANWPGDVLAVLGLFIYAPAAAGLVYFAGYGLLALAVGHTRIHTWLTTAMEVDAAPPNVFCQMKIYAAFNVSPKGGLRHGLYEREDVVEDIGKIVLSVAGSHGTSPEPLTATSHPAPRV
ncbi:esterase/lipase family protein [Caenimonas soli]|uniref:esterase/lipase family protein n=1 Tax=Caenimonas soli TaxID=2735555 RepID=UPI0015544EA6|nr:hypothetical protein [Caenimonas soli]NPC57830.1 hypothetical protein [Caenimonas soli]